MADHIKVHDTGNPVDQYTVTVPTTGPFVVSFVFFALTDVAVYINDGVTESKLTYSADYTVTANVDFEGGFNGGSVEFTTLRENITVTIVPEIPYDRESDFPVTGKFNITTLNTTLDRMMMLMQQLRAGLARSLQAPISAVANYVLPAPVANMLLGWTSDGLQLENKSIPAGTAVYSSIANTRLLTATAEAVTPDGLASFLQKGLALTAAATIAKPADANLGGVYTVNGNTQIDNFWTADRDGEEMEHRYSGIPIIGAGGNIIPPTEAAFQIVAGDTIRWRWEGGLSKWRCYGGARASGVAFVSVSVSPAGSDLYLWSSFC